MAVDQDIIDKAGAWYAYEGERIGQGREKAKDYLDDPEHADLRQELYIKVRQAYGINGDGNDFAPTSEVPEDKDGAVGQTADLDLGIDDDLTDEPIV